MKGRVYYDPEEPVMWAQVKASGNVIDVDCRPDKRLRGRPTPLVVIDGERKDAEKLRGRGRHPAVERDTAD